MFLFLFLGEDLSFGVGVWFTRGWAGEDLKGVTEKKASKEEEEEEEGGKKKKGKVNFVRQANLIKSAYSKISLN